MSEPKTKPLKVKVHDFHESIDKTVKQKFDNFIENFDFSLVKVLPDIKCRSGDVASENLHFLTKDFPFIDKSVIALIKGAKKQLIEYNYDKNTNCTYMYVFVKTEKNRYDYKIIKQQLSWQVDIGRCGVVAGISYLAYCVNPYLAVATIIVSLGNSTEKVNLTESDQITLGKSVFLSICVMHGHVSIDDKHVYMLIDNDE